MAALWNGAGHYIFALWFLSFFFFYSPNLSGCRLDVYHTSRLGEEKKKKETGQKYNVRICYAERP